MHPIGTLPSDVGRRQIVKTKGIRIGDIVSSFLKQDNILEPQEFFKQICFEETAFLPCYYYIRKSGINNDEAVAVLKSVVSRSKSKDKLIERITAGSKQNLTLPMGDTVSAKKKHEYKKQLIERRVDQSLSDKDLECCLQTIRGLSAEEIKAHSTYLFGLLRTWFNRHYESAKGSVADNLRRTICWTDEAMFKDATRITSTAPSKPKLLRRRK